MHATTGSRPFSCITTQQGYGVLHPAGGSTEQLHQTCLCKRQRISKRGFPKGHTIWNVWILGSNMTSYSRNMLRITTDQAGWVIATWFFPKGDREKWMDHIPKVGSYRVTKQKIIEQQLAVTYGPKSVVTMNNPCLSWAATKLILGPVNLPPQLFLRPQALKRSRALKINAQATRITTNSPWFFKIFPLGLKEKNRSKLDQPRVTRLNLLETTT